MCLGTGGVAALDDRLQDGKPRASIFKLLRLYGCIQPATAIAAISAAGIEGRNR